MNGGGDSVHGFDDGYEFDGAFDGSPPRISAETWRRIRARVYDVARWKAAWAAVIARETRRGAVKGLEE